MSAKFQINKSKDNQFYFNLKTASGDVILTSGMYAEKSTVKSGIESVRANATVDSLFDRRKSPTEKPYFVLKATNHEVIGTSEMFSSTGAMKNAIETVMKTAPGAPVEDRS